MLSDHERATLREVERQILAEDPRFVQIFDSQAKRLPSALPKSLDQGRRTYTVLMWVATMLSLLMAVAGSAAGAVLFAVAAVTFALACHRAASTV